MSENTTSNKKQYLVWGAITILYILLAICCFSCSTPKVATVNAPMVVARSQAIRLLQQEQQEQYDSMQNWLQDSNKQLKKETSQDKRKELLAKLQAEFSQKQIAMQQQYLAKTQKIEDDIIAIIKAVADKKGYKVVMDKASVIVGGTDITDEVIASLEEAEANIVVEEETVTVEEMAEQMPEELTEKAVETTTEETQAPAEMEEKAAEEIKSE